MSYEVRNMSIKTELRALEDGEDKFIEGFIPYDSRSFDMGFFEVIKNGAFKRSINNSDIRCLWNHNDTFVLGRTSNSNLEFEDKDDGLHFKVKVPQTRSYGVDAYDVVKTGDADGVSFRFRVIKEEIEKSEKDVIRNLLEVQLIEVSVGVTFPAYPNSKAQTRAFNEVTGIDLNKFASTMVRSESINDDDKEYLENVITQIRTLMGEITLDSVEDHSNSTEDSIDITLRKMQLELLAKSFE